MQACLLPAACSGSAPQERVAALVAFQAAALRANLLGNNLSLSELQIEGMFNGTAYLQSQCAPGCAALLLCSALRLVAA